MANNREAQSQRVIIGAMFAVGREYYRGQGMLHDPEKQRLNEIIDRLSDLYGAEVSDDDKLHFATGIADRIERDEAMMAHIRNHSEVQVMHGLFPQKGHRRRA